MAFKVEQKIGNHVYVYKAKSYWDKEKKQPRQKRTYLGKKDLVTGKIINTKKKEKHIPVKSVDFGNIYFLKQLTRKIGLTEIVESIFPERSKEILALVNYAITENNPHYLASDWAELSYIDLPPKNISSQRISELLESLGSNQSTSHEFFEQWIKKQDEIKAIYYDITSLSTFSKLLDWAEWGYNRDKEKLKQINLGVVYGEKSKMPLYYKVYPGSITDVTTLHNIIKYNKCIGLTNVIYILDRGFYSQTNIKKLDNRKVIMPLSFSTNIAKNLLNSAAKQLTSSSQMTIIEDNLYYYFKKNIQIAELPFAAHIYRNKKIYHADETEFMKLILEIENKINKDNFTDEEALLEAIEVLAKGYSKYYDVVNKNNKFSIRQNRAQICKKINRFGTFILITNVKNISKERIFKLFRRKDAVEKVFDKMKNYLDKDRLRVNTKERVKGTLFLIFISLIITSHIENNLKTNKVLKKYTKKKLIYELKKLKITQFKNGINILNELSKKVKDIFKEFDIDLPGLET